MSCDHQWEIDTVPKGTKVMKRPKDGERTVVDKTIEDYTGVWCIHCGKEFVQCLK